MKTKILLLTVIAFSPVAFAQQPSIKAATKEAVLQAIANRPPPGRARSVKKVAITTLSEPKGPRMPLYYSTQQIVPPLPFNPFPELQLYDLGDNKFMYDDHDVDRVSLWKEREQSAMAQSANAEGAYAGESQEVSGGSPQSLLSDGVRLHITMTGSNSYSLRMTNLFPGTQYLLTDKLEFINDIRAQWTPLFLFTAASNSATFSGTFAEDHQFFEVWDWDAYIGPVVALTSPADGALLSGKVKITGGVGDIFPDGTAELYVDGNMVLSMTNGPLDFDLDTQMFANGTHQIDVLVGTIPLTSDNVQFSSVASLLVTFTNFLTSINNGSFFSYGATTVKFNTTRSASYTFDIFDAGGALKRSFSGNSAGGDVQISWDMRDSNGNQLPTGADYTFQIVATGTSGGAAAAGMTFTNRWTSFAEGTFQAGHSFLFYLKRDFIHEGYELSDLFMLDWIRSLVEHADIFGPDPVGREAVDNSLYLWQSNGQKTNILNTIKRTDVGHVFYVGHGSGEDIGTGTDTVITERITTSEVKAALSNEFNVVTGVYRFRNPKRYVEIDGCSTSIGDLPWAFGIPKENTDLRPTVAPRSYFGWNNVIYAGWVNSSWHQDHVTRQNSYWHYIDDGSPYITIRNAILFAIRDYNSRISVSETGLYGSRFLTWAVNND